LAEAKSALTAEEIAKRADLCGVETVYHVLRHLAANPVHRVQRTAGSGPAQDEFRLQ
jgi:glucose-6-phosphate isomerase